MKNLKWLFRNAFFYLTLFLISCAVNAHAQTPTYGTRGAIEYFAASTPGTDVERAKFRVAKKTPLNQMHFHGVNGTDSMFNSSIRLDTAQYTIIDTIGPHLVLCVDLPTGFLQNGGSNPDGCLYTERGYPISGWSYDGSSSNYHAIELKEPGYEGFRLPHIGLSALTNYDEALVCSGSLPGNAGWSKDSADCYEHTLTLTQQLCPKPQIIDMSSGTHDVTLSWSVDSVFGYIVRLRSYDEVTGIAGNIMEKNVPGHLTSVTFDGLIPGTLYQAQLRKICPEGAISKPDRDNDELMSLRTKQVENFAIYPNPASSLLSLQLPTSSEVLNMEIFSITGQQVSIDNISGNQLDISHLQAGQYIVKILTKTAVHTGQFLKQ